MRQCLGFFPYETMNYKAAQAYLDRKAAKGWALQHIYLGAIARFIPAETPRHFVDLDIREHFEKESDPDYLQLCTDAGWEHIQTLRGMLFFRAADGADPIPIQSDADLEWERFWRKYARKNLISTAVALLLGVGILAVILGLTPGPGRSVASLAASDSALLYLLSLGMGLVSILLSFIGVPLYLLRCRKSGQVESPGQAWAWIQDAPFRLSKPLYLIAALVALLEIFGVVGTTVDLALSGYNHEETATVEACREYPVVMAADLGLRNSEDSRYLDGHRSPLAEFLNYSEISPRTDPEAPLYILTTERYECVSESLARWIINIRRDETRKGAFLWGELDWQTAPDLGFEECYTCRENSYLLLRQGNVVALVGCAHLDLTTPERLPLIRARLGL